ncbi:hypothetical protein D3C79_718670 [compost metagenome]
MLHTFAPTYLQAPLLIDAPHMQAATLPDHSQFIARLIQHLGSERQGATVSQACVDHSAAPATGGVIQQRRSTGARHHLLAADLQFDILRRAFGVQFYGVETIGCQLRQDGITASIKAYLRRLFEPRVRCPRRVHNGKALAK